MDKEQRKHEAAMKKKEDESRESGENRLSSGSGDNAPGNDGEHSINTSSQEKKGERTNSGTFNAGGNDSDYDGGQPKDTLSDSDGRIDSNSTNSKEN